MTRSSFLPYGRQSIDKSDIQSVVRVLRSDRITQGPEVEKFEKSFAEYVGAPYAVAVSSGTAGLHLACMASGLGPNEEVISTPMSFVATSNAVLYAGGIPRFVDICDSDLGLDPAQARRALNQKTKGIIPVHFAGTPCQVSRKTIKGTRDVFVIEDACHALGAEVRRGDGSWVKVGACDESDMAVFSFHPVKHLTTGEGGMITTRRRDLYDKLNRFRSHGIERNSSRWKHRTKDPWYYEMTALGFYYRLTDIQCALGSSQLCKLPSWVKRRREIASIYSKNLSPIEGVRVPTESEHTRSSYHLYVLRVDFKLLGLERASVMRALSKRGIGTQVHYIPIPRQPYYAQLGYSAKDYPVAEKYYQEALSIPLYPDLTSADVRRVISEVKKALCHK